MVDNYVINTLTHKKHEFSAIVNKIYHFIVMLKVDISQAKR